ncbi:MAG: glycosyltransferase family 2 protein, partial [Armatimonadota bacterium]|nr:glycosyltransferase family 2 protein [Armatimonadota bacterium]
MSLSSEKAILQLSVVLPCYNESRGLKAILDSFQKAGRGVDYELILVNNGSTDDTTAVLQTLLPAYPFARTVTIEQNQGYGHGLMTGLQSAIAPVVAWSHADLQTDPADVFRALHLFQQNGTGPPL